MTKEEGMIVIHQAETSTKEATTADREMGRGEETTQEVDLLRQSEREGFPGETTAIAITHHAILQEVELHLVITNVLTALPQGNTTDLLS